MSEAQGAQERHGPAPAEHFGSLAQETHAERLGMWIFLGSESLLFAGLFTLYAAYRATYHNAFQLGIGEQYKLLGSLNTVILLTSSLSAALSVAAIERGHLKRGLLGVGVTVFFALSFLVIKISEYALHLEEGYRPGGWQLHDVSQTTLGLESFFTLYYLTTGVHAVHVSIGIVVLSWLALGLWRRTLRKPAVALELGVLYWHLVDVMWIFIWPLYYLAGGTH